MSLIEKFEDFEISNEVGVKIFGGDSSGLQEHAFNSITGG